MLQSAENAFCTLHYLALPVSVDEAGVDVVAALDAPERLEAHAAGLEGEDVDQTVLELVHGEVGRHKPGDRLEFEVKSLENLDKQEFSHGQSSTF